MRVAVEFGKSKVYTALVYSIHDIPPIGYEAKEIFQILDEEPVVNNIQLQHWEWISSYYMCSLGEVFRAALPSAFLLESETVIQQVVGFNNEEILSNDEFLIYEALQYQQQLSVNQIVEILGRKTVFPIIKDLIEKNVISVKEQIYEQYKPKLIKYVRLKATWNSNEKLAELLKTLSRAQKQRDVILTYFQLQTTKKPIKVTDLQEKSNSSSSIIKSLVDKNILEYYFIQIDRINFKESTSEIKELTSYQQEAYVSIQKSFENK